MEYSQQDNFTDYGTKLRDLEEKIRLLKDRLLLVGKSMIEQREKTLEEMGEMKKAILKLSEENSRMRELLGRVSEQLSSSARKEELLILQRQLDLLRE